MPIETQYLVSCDKCKAIAGPGRESRQDAQTHALNLGWSVYPMLCVRCHTKAERDIRTKGLYLTLVKTLNELDEAGENADLATPTRIEGRSHSVLRRISPTDRWIIDVRQEGL